MSQNIPTHVYNISSSRLSSSGKKHPVVLIAEDDEEMRKLLVCSLHNDGYEVMDCKNGWDILSRLEPFIEREQPLEFDIIISDIRMPGVTGLEILEDLHAKKYFPPMILITAFGDSEIHARAKKLGAAALFDKPFKMDDLLAKVRELILP